MAERKWMATPLLASCFGLVLIGGMASPGSGSTGKSDPPGSLGRGVEGADYVLLTEEEVHQDTVRALMELSGWTAEEVEWSLVRDNAAGAISEEIARNRPDAYIGFSVSTTDPYEPPKIYVKGEAGPYIRRLVGESLVPVELVDKQPLTLAELEARADEVYQALEDVGYSSVSTGFRLKDGGLISAAVMVEPGLPSKANAVREKLPAAMRSYVRIGISETPTSEGHAAFGGMRTTDGVVDGCTAGFSVTVNGLDGIVSAGHCNSWSGYTRIYDPRTGSYSPIVHGKTYAGAYGDFEWYRMGAGYSSGPYFISKHSVGTYYTTGVSGVLGSASLGEGAQLCFYRRTTKTQECGTVYMASVSCEVSYLGNAKASRMVMMNRSMGEPGDSGGTFFQGSKVAGTYHGYCQNMNDSGQLVAKATFSKAAYVNLAFSESILVKVK